MKGDASDTEDTSVLSIANIIEDKSSSTDPEKQAVSKSNQYYCKMDAKGTSFTKKCNKNEATKCKTTVTKGKLKGKDSKGAEITDETIDHKKIGEYTQEKTEEKTFNCGEDPDLPDNKNGATSASKKFAKKTDVDSKEKTFTDKYSGFKSKTKDKGKTDSKELVTSKKKTLEDGITKTESKMDESVKLNTKVSYRKTNFVKRDGMFTTCLFRMFNVAFYCFGSDEKIKPEGADL